MKTEFQHYLSSLCAAVALIAIPLASHAIPITYDIGAGSAPGFSASWLHAGTVQMGSSGYFANGDKASMSGSLTLDMADLASASGQLTGSGDFGLGSDDWTLDFSGASAGTLTFFGGGETDLLSLNYALSSLGGHSSTGTFYFADRDFNSGTIDDGPNFISPDLLYLWGNNWINISGGTTDRDAFVTPCGGGVILSTDSSSCGGIALGLDLHGHSVPEPGIVTLLAIGLIGFGVSRRKKTV